MKHRIKKVVRRLPSKKPYFEVVGAILTIPVLITVILLNLNNLSLSKNAKTAASPTLIPQQVIIHDSNPIIVTATPNPIPSPTQMPNTTSCQKSVGPISIEYPQEGQTVKDTTLCFIIHHDDSNYCSVVWSYRINGGAYSDFGNNSPCIYNLPNGATEFDLRAQSTVSNDQTFTARRFNYQGNSSAPTPTQ